MVFSVEQTSSNLLESLLPALALPGGVGGVGGEESNVV